MKKISAIACLVFLFGCVQNPERFTHLSPEESGIDFTNEITATAGMNIVNYEYLYNGGGTGVGDFNGDGLPDLFFAGNQVPSKMYMNKGSLKFEDVTDRTGILPGIRWAKGISVIDINGDGLPDIYLSVAQEKEPEKRRNLLYVSQGNNPETGIPLFREMAADYGLNDTSHTQMASFFDYDNDGDLDVFLLVNELEQSTNAYVYQSVRDSTFNRDKLFQNNWDNEKGHPVFSDVSMEAGISYGGYGLGVHTADLNLDGWTDIYVSNDFLSNDVLYINNGNGGFTNEIRTWFKYTARNGMGLDIADFNNDSLDDIIQLDMMPGDNFRAKTMFNPMNYNTYQNYDRYGYMYQYPRNVLQLNQGFYQVPGQAKAQPLFAEIGFLAGITSTDWSWSSLFADLDNDGWKDLIVSNGLPKDMSDMDFMAYRDQALNLVPVEQILNELPSVKISNFIFRNNRDLSFADKTVAWGWNQPGFSAGMAYADLDTDGDLDVVLNNTNMPSQIIRNNQRELSGDSSRYLRIQLKGDSLNKTGIGSKMKIFYKGQVQSATLNPYRGYLSSVEDKVHFGTGNVQMVDSLVVLWPDGNSSLLKNIPTDTTITISRNTATAGSRVAKEIQPFFKHTLNQNGLHFFAEEMDYVDYSDQRLLPHKLSQYGPGIACSDIDGDGRSDVIIGGSAGKPVAIFRQLKDGLWEKEILGNFTLQHKGDNLGICLFDADNDGFPDLYIATGGNEYPAENNAYADFFYRNNGKGKFIADSTAFPTNYSSSSAVKAADINGDGYLDLFVGTRNIPGRYPMAGSGIIYLNDGKGRFENVTKDLAPGLENIGMITDALWTDINNDHAPDLLVVGEWMAPRLFKNENGKLVLQTTVLGEYTGWFNSIGAGDIDNDGDMDYVLGNYGMNGFLRPDPHYPVNIYSGDFQGNNGFGSLLTSFYPFEPQGELREFPVAGRDDVIHEIFYVRRKFPFYHQFARATVDSILDTRQKNDAHKLSATFAKSCWIENKGNYEFIVHELPVQAQFSPVFGSVLQDINADGKLDILISGNDHSMAPYLGMNAASNGLVLLGDGKGGFVPLQPGESGLYIPGDAKALAAIPSGNTLLYLATQNKGPLVTFEWQNRTAQPILPIRAGDISALVTMQNGSKRKMEFYYGSGYLAQSARYLVVPPRALEIRFFSRNGNERVIKAGVQK